MSVWPAAIADWSSLLGSDRVLADPSRLAPWHRNVSGLERRVPCVLQPATADQVAGIVLVARRHRTPLYPVSCGRNWGMGSRLPVRDDCAVVDLSGLNRIREVNAGRRYAVIEPGVTQGQLHRHLQEIGAPLMLNPTGAPRETSLIGNALDRGVGYFASRANALTGLEVVLGTGRVLRTGFAHYPGARTTHLYRHGVGPSLDGLFAQSNYGIVTAAGFELLPRPHPHTAVLAKIADDDGLPALIDTLAALRRRGLLQTVAHIGNRARTEISLAPLVSEQLVALGAASPASAGALAVELLRREGFGAWGAVAGLTTSGRMQRAERAEVRRALRGVARTSFLGDGLLRIADRALRAMSGVDWCRRKLAVLRAVTPLHNLVAGIPTDAGLPSVYWPVPGAYPGGADPDEGHAGMLYCLPILPADGTFALECMTRTREIFGADGFTPYTTLNLLDDRSIEAVIGLAFDRRDAARAGAALACIRRAEQFYLDAGCPPYRVGIASMDAVVQPDDPFWQTVRDLKQSLDPDGILAPGRYNLI